MSGHGIDFVIVDDFMYVQQTDGMIRKYLLTGEIDENFTPIPLAGLESASIVCTIYAEDDYLKGIES